tara:strand:- start:471 stop:1253 length:783 start_codon:yes stop_codon:yes gene_type:complete
MIYYRNLFLAILFWILNSVAHAGLILDEVVETMMEVNALETLFIGQNFGVDQNSSIQFESNVNIEERSFSYFTVPNQTHNGSNISLSTVGSYDSILGEYIWTSDGIFGNQNWSSSGTAKWVGDPVGTFDVTFTLPNGNSPITVSMTADVEYMFFPSATRSTGTYTFESDNGTKWGPFSGTDIFSQESLMWTHSVNVGKSNVTPNGIAKVTTGLLASRGENGVDFAGDFEVQIREVPEPKTSLLMVLGLCCFGIIRKLNNS